MICSSDWKTASIQTIAAAEKWSLNGGPFGSKLVSSMYVSDGIPVIRGSNLRANTRFYDDDFVFVSPDKAQELRAHAARPGDVIFTQRGTLGQVGLIPHSARFQLYIVSQSQMKLTVDHHVADPSFIYYTFRCASVEAEFVSRAASSGVPHVNLQTLRGFEIRLPPLAEQRRIAAILTAYDDLIEVNRRRIDLLDRMAHGFFEEWFVRFRFPGHSEPVVQDALPKGWQLAPIKLAYSGLYDGPHATPAPATQGPIFLGIGNLSETGGLDLTSVRHIAEEDFATWTKRVVPQEGDIVFTYEATLNRYALILKNFRGCLGRRLALVRASSNAGMNRYIYQYFFTDAWRAVIASNKISGATVDRVPLSKFPEFPIVLPPPDLISRFDLLIRPILDGAQSLKLSNNKLVAARDLLLPRLISGQLPVSAAKRELLKAA